MALPVTISGISTAVATVGPFKSSGGNYYFFGRDNATATTLQAYKATTPDTAGSWDSIATRPGFTTAILLMSGYQVADVIHLLVMDGTMSTSVATKYVSFDMASDTFLASTETVNAAALITGLATGGWGCSLVVRSTGEVVALYNGVQTKTTNNYSRLYYKRRTGVNTWSAAVQVDTNTAKDSIEPAAVLAASDVVHFLNWIPTAGSIGVTQRTLSAANALQTSSTTVAFSLSAALNPLIPAVSYNNAGTQKIVGILRVGSTSGTVSAVRFDSGNTPAVSSSTVGTGSVNVSTVGMFNDGTDVYGVYYNTSTTLLACKSTDNGATWAAGIPMSTDASPGLQNLSRSGNVYQRDSNIVIPYIYFTTGALLKYNELVVRAVTSAAKAPPVFQSPRKVFAFSGRTR